MDRLKSHLLSGERALPLGALCGGPVGGRRTVVDGVHKDGIGGGGGGGRHLALQAARQAGGPPPPGQRTPPAP
jgi:hypothetical protein